MDEKYFTAPYVVMLSFTAFLLVIMIITSIREPSLFKKKLKEEEAQKIAERKELQLHRDKIKKCLAKSGWKFLFNEWSADARVLGYREKGVIYYDIFANKEAQTGSCKKAFRIRFKSEEYVLQVLDACAQEITQKNCDNLPKLKDEEEAKIREIKKDIQTFVEQQNLKPVAFRTNPFLTDGDISYGYYFDSEDNLFHFYKSEGTEREQDGTVLQKIEFPEYFFDYEDEGNLINASVSEYEVLETIFDELIDEAKKNLGQEYKAKYNL